MVRANAFSCVAQCEVGEIKYSPNYLLKGQCLKHARMGSGKGIEDPRFRSKRLT